MSAFTHVAVGSNDLARSGVFYDAALGALGMKRLFEMPGGLGWGTEGPSFITFTPRDGEAATHANGGTIGFAASSRAAVDAFHAGGLAHGGSCEGEPGLRAFRPHAYGAYLRDPDGNKLCAFCYAPE